MRWELPQDGCTNDTSAPVLSRCWAAKRAYVDIGAYGAAFGASGTFERTNYLVHAIDVDLLCTAIMDYDCVNRYGPLGCYQYRFPRASRSAPSTASDAAGGPAAGGNGSEVLKASGGDVGDGGGGGGGGGQDQTALLAGLLAGVLGGVTLLVAAAWAALRGCSACGLQPLWQPRPGGGDKGEGTPDGAAPDAAAPFPDSKHGPSSEAGAGLFDPSIQGAKPRSSELGGRDGTSTSGTLGQGLSPVDPVGPITELTPQRPDLQLLRSGGGSNVAGASDGGVGGEENAGRRVAVKVVSDAHQFGGPGESLIRSFAQEVEVLGRCTHPNVVRLLAACLTPPRLCLVMELMETSLDRVLYGKPESTPLPLPTVLHISLEVAKGLEYLHPTITHRDLKPGNVLLNDPHSPRPTVKLADFGLSRLRSTVVPTVTPDAGTPAYLSPEGFDAANYVITHQADMYSLAVLVWEMLAGSKPWQGCSLYEVAHALTTRGARLPLDSLPEARCPPRLRALLQQCWERDPRRRPAAAEAVKALALALLAHRALLRGGSHDAPPLPSPNPAGGERLRSLACGWDGGLPSPGLLGGGLPSPLGAQTGAWLRSPASGGSGEMTAVRVADLRRAEGVPAQDDGGWSDSALQLTRMSESAPCMRSSTAAAGGAARSALPAAGLGTAAALSPGSLAEAGGPSGAATVKAARQADGPHHESHGSPLSPAAGPLAGTRAAGGLDSAAADGGAAWALPQGCDQAVRARATHMEYLSYSNLVASASNSMAPDDGAA
ncbi:hypothetical protein HYH03_014682 [Edaphochlamys debaryana]|uniref:Protein kinase domain-containing protein n=1 Tax=Edaphochlamys debaryana TaxID=47281 RepID=A0A836BRX0_9CHLO|nr:hypothetical protein HYH03_014682 [Edaphochlamys debaryana]|eukprot:KAG2486625.1 hypothetical protein HYH03_014682 [Edaphochlamys debaryana]